MPIYEVTDERTMREAIDRTVEEDDVVVTFKVPEIEFTDSSKLKLDKNSSGITIRGPVTLKAVQFWFDRVDDEINLENLRVRVGADHLDKGDAMDALYAEKCDELKLTNCTFSDSSDEVISLNYCDEVLIERCIIGDPLHIPTVNNEGKEFVHEEGSKGSHGYGIRSSAIKHLTIVDTVFGNCYRRAPQCNNQKVREDTTYRFEVNNCVIYNYGQHGFTYNNKEKEEEDGAKYKVNFHHNLFVPGPRTNKLPGSNYEALEFDCETPEKMKFTVYNMHTNKIAGYDKMYVRYKDDKYYIDSGEGPTKSYFEILDRAGCLSHDRQDANLIANIKTTLDLGHQYDYLEPEYIHMLWPNSGWKNYS